MTASKVRQIMNVIADAAYIPMPLQDYHAAIAARDGYRCKTSIARTIAVQRALKKYRVMVSMFGEQTRIYNPATRAEYIA